MTHPDELFGIFAEMLTPLNDSHVPSPEMRRYFVEFGTDALNTPFFNDAVSTLRTHVTRRKVQPHWQTAGCLPPSGMSAPAISSLRHGRIQ
jgi:hypothetical protein